MTSRLDEIAGRKGVVEYPDVAHPHIRVTPAERDMLVEAVRAAEAFRKAASDYFNDFGDEVAMARALSLYREALAPLLEEHDAERP